MHPTKHPKKNPSRTCPECEGAGRWVACSHGICPCRGEVVVCERCRGDGELPPLCEGCSEADAEVVDGRYCAACLAELEADDDFAHERAHGPGRF